MPEWRTIGIGYAVALGWLALSYVITPLVFTLPFAGIVFAGCVFASYVKICQKLFGRYAWLGGIVGFIVLLFVVAFVVQLF